MATNYNSSLVRLAPDGRVLVAPLGTAEPTDTTTAFNAAFKELGWITEDGVSVTPSIDTNDVMMWQSITPVKRPITGMGLEVSMALASHNKDVLQNYLLNATFSNVSGTARFEVKNLPPSQEKMLAIEWTDDDGDTNRLILPKVTMTDRDAFTIQKSDAVAFGITFSALAGAGGYTAVLLSNNTDLLS